MEQMKEKVSQMTKSFSECAETMSQHSKNINFYEHLVARVKQEKSIGRGDNPYNIQSKESDSETAYFNSSGHSQHSGNSHLMK